MKKIFVVLLICIGLFILSGCTTKPMPHEQMANVTPFAQTIDIGWFEQETYWFTKQYRLNDKEYLFYAPQKYIDGEDIYLNPQECYWFRSGTPEQYSWKLATQSDLEKIFG